MLIGFLIHRVIILCVNRKEKEKTRREVINASSFPQTSVEARQQGRDGRLVQLTLELTRRVRFPS